jgi:hypothetical protein
LVNAALAAHLPDPASRAGMEIHTHEEADVVWLAYKLPTMDKPSAFCCFTHPATRQQGFHYIAEWHFHQVPAPDHSKN